jgi:chloramphenicol 3-O-phosphotransferase
MKSVELALQVIQNRTFMHVEIYDHFERYPAELLGQTEWKSLPIDSKEKVEVADASYSLHPFLGSLVEWRYWSIERFKYTPTNNEVYWSEGDGEREREEYSICIVLYSICMYMYVYVCICMYMYVYV